MASYNAINGVPACENADLLRRKLREEWGFRGFVVSDWFAVRSTSSTAACVKGGLSLEMPGKGSRYRYKNLKRAYEQGLFSEADVDGNLCGLLTAMALTGHLDATLQRGQRNTPQHQALAREMAEAGMTLLKNDGALLPLDPSKVRKIAVLGPKLNKRNCLPLWGGSAGVWPPYEITPWQGLQRENRARFEWVSDPAQADAVLLFVGLSHRPGLDSEVMDRKRLELPKKQEKLIRETVARNANTVVVLINGSPIAMPWVDSVPAILECWYPGMEAGTAIARTLFGDNNPSGKLPVTFPRSLADSPAHASARTFPGDRRTVHYDEELLVGYRHFDKVGIAPLFAFGHGLSYTQFEFRDVQLSAARFRPGDTMAVTLTVINTGKVAGAEVVQLYIAPEQPDDDRPLQVLSGFKKVWLAPGEAQSLTLEVPMAQLHIFCPRSNTWQPRPGNYTARLGSSSRDIRLRADFSLVASA
jgi:beta-glucosidase